MPGTGTTNARQGLVANLEVVEVWAEADLSSLLHIKRSKDRAKGSLQHHSTSELAAPIVGYPSRVDKPAHTCHAQPNSHIHKGVCEHPKKVKRGIRQIARQLAGLVVRRSPNLTTSFLFPFSLFLFFAFTFSNLICKKVVEIIWLNESQFVASQD